VLEVPTTKPEDSGNWQPVRDSWVEDPRVPRTDPPPLPASMREVPAVRAPDDAAFAELMLERLAASDYAGALVAAEALLRHSPTDADALDCAQMCRAELQKVYVARLGSLERVPCVPHGMGPDHLASIGLDAIALAVIEQVDGTRDVAEIIRSAALPPFDVLRALSELYLRRLVALP
jgi:hypothetical protein